MTRPTGDPEDWPVQEVQEEPVTDEAPPADPNAQGVTASQTGPQGEDKTPQS